MKFKDDNIFGLVVWGTKRGKNVFFSCNIEEDTETIDNSLYDIRTPVQFPGVNLTFYSFEHNSRYNTFTVYRTIYDWANRLGYYAVSLIFPADKTFQENSVTELLKSLSDIYWERYISSNHIPNRIKENTQEDKRIFETELKKDLYLLKQVDQQHHSIIGSQKCTLKFKDTDELASIFEQYQRDELLPYSQAIILPANQPNLTCSYPEVALAPVQKKYKLVIKTYEGNEKKLLFDTKVYVTRNNEAEKEYNAVYGACELQGLFPHDKIKLFAKHQGFETTKPIDFELRKYLENGDSKPPEVPVHLFPLNIPKNTGRAADSGINQKSPGDSNRDMGNKAETVRQDAAAPESKQPVFKSEPTGEQPIDSPKSLESKKWYDKLKQYWMTILLTLAVIVVLIFILAILFYFDSGTSKGVSRYEELDNKIDSVTKVLIKPGNFNTLKYEELIAFNKKTRDEISKKPRELGSLSTALDSTLILFNIKFDSAIGILITSNDTWDMARADNLIKISEDMYANFKVPSSNSQFQYGTDEIKADTSRLKQFKHICEWINYAEEQIGGIGKGSKTLTEIHENLDDIKNSKAKGNKYLFIDKKQEDKISRYVRVIKGIERYGSLDNYKSHLKNDRYNVDEKANNLLLQFIENRSKE